ncbi:hypothetical protein BD779DRAFT_1433267 [Infundibulicybe gibba]|nr:hypothetical protein BD779DRAFT_1433267 [Infundibulicybe gibba]
MSSKRGRKRNDNLPPNRARDVQRAFRARRAAHLQALEQRVSELEEENTCLRQALNLPPANRPPLGKGPTGKDKPKSYDGTPSSTTLSLYSGHDSSSADSPSSTRTSSLSPTAINVSVPSRPMQLIENSGWDQELLMSDPQHDLPSPSEQQHYHLSSMNTPVPSKQPPQQYSSYPSAVPSSSRTIVPNNSYMTAQSNYPSHATERPLSSSYGAQPYIMRDEPRPQYSYPHPAYQHDPNMHSHTPPPPSGVAPIHTSSHHVPQRESPAPYANRRSLHEYSISQGFSHLHQGIRQPEHSRLQEAGTPQSHPPHRSVAYGADGRINPM